jgi:hypothetical protein
MMRKILLLLLFADFKRVVAALQRLLNSFPLTLNAQGKEKEKKAKHAIKKGNLPCLNTHMYLEV